MFVVLLVSDSDNLIKGLDLQDKDLGRRVERGWGEDGERGGEGGERAGRGWGEGGERVGRGWEEDGAQLTVEDGYFANTKT